MPFSAPWLELLGSVDSMISTISPDRVQLGLTAQLGLHIGAFERQVDSRVMMHHAFDRMSEFYYSDMGDHLSKV